MYECGYAIAIGVSSGDCTTYTTGVSVSSQIESRRSTGVVFLLTISGQTASVVSVLTAGCSGSCTSSTLSSSIQSASSAMSVSVGSIGNLTVAASVTSFTLNQGVHASRVCGDGRLEALAPGDQGTCPGVGSQLSNFGSVTPENCDTSSGAGFGKFNSGCGENSGCDLMSNTVPSLVEIVDASVSGLAGRLKQLQFGLLTGSMGGTFDYNPYAAASSSNVVPRINPCLYSTRMLKADGTLTSDVSLAVRCDLTAADRLKYKSISYCYESQNLGASPTVSELAAFGRRLDNSDSNFALYGHKCQWPVSVRVDSAAGGPMTWKSTERNSVEKIVAPFSGLYDLCFSLQDPSWPAIHPSSREVRLS